MKYPRTPEHLDARKKLMAADILTIRHGRAAGMSVKELAGRFGVSIQIIYYWTDPEIRRKRLENRSAYGERRSHEVKAAAQKKSYERKIALLPQFLKYHIERSKKWRLANPGEYRDYMRNYMRRKRYRKLCTAATSKKMPHGA